jgi:hypothetical protein
MHQPFSAATDPHALRESFGPALREACDGRLGPIEWFRSSWQHGGAATGLSDWNEGGASIPAIVKLPVPPIEHRWTVLMGDGCHGPTPRVLAHGDSLGGRRVDWLVLERLPGAPLSAQLDQQAVLDLVRTAAVFQKQAAERCPLEPAPPDKDWHELVDRARGVVRMHGIPEEQRWNDALRLVQKSLGSLVARWRARPIDAWCHGDLHPGNALRRAPSDAPDASPAVLIDLALVHPGHWVEDAVYLERLHWARPGLLHGVKPVAALAKARRELGLPTDEPGGAYVNVANLRRVLMAAVVPAFLDREGHPAYTHAALEVLERVLPQVIH